MDTNYLRIVFQSIKRKLMLLLLCKLRWCESAEEFPGSSQLLREIYSKSSNHYGTIAWIDYERCTLDLGIRTSTPNCFWSNKERTCKRLYNGFLQPWAQVVNHCGCQSRWSRSICYPSLTRVEMKELQKYSQTEKVPMNLGSYPGYAPLSTALVGCKIFR